MNSSDLKILAREILGRAGWTLVDQLLGKNVVNGEEIARELIRRGVDTLYTTRSITREEAMGLYNRLDLPVESVSKFPQGYYGT